MKDKIFTISRILIGLTLLMGLTQQPFFKKLTSNQIKISPLTKEETKGITEYEPTPFPPLPPKNHKHIYNNAYLVAGGDIMFSRNI